MSHKELLREAFRNPDRTSNASSSWRKVLLHLPSDGVLGFVGPDRPRKAVAHSAAKALRDG